jgi:hypothetical protein
MKKILLLVLINSSPVSIIELCKSANTTKEYLLCTGISACAIFLNQYLKDDKHKNLLEDTRAKINSINNLDYTIFNKEEDGASASSGIKSTNATLFNKNIFLDNYINKNGNNIASPEAFKVYNKLHLNIFALNQYESGSVRNKLFFLNILGHTAMYLPLYYLAIKTLLSLKERNDINAWKFVIPLELATIATTTFLHHKHKQYLEKKAVEEAVAVDNNSISAYPWYKNNPQYYTSLISFTIAIILIMLGIKKK